MLSRALKCKRVGVKPDPHRAAGIASPLGDDNHSVLLWPFCFVVDLAMNQQGGAGLIGDVSALAKVLQCRGVVLPRPFFSETELRSSSARDSSLARPAIATQAAVTSRYLCAWWLLNRIFCKIVDADDGCAMSALRDASPGAKLVSGQADESSSVIGQVLTRSAAASTSLFSRRSADPGYAIG